MIQLIPTLHFSLLHNAFYCKINHILNFHIKIAKQTYTGRSNDVIKKISVFLFVISEKIFLEPVLLY